VTENAPVITAWDAIIVASTATTTIGTCAHFGISPKNGVATALGSARIRGALPEVVDEQSREHDEEPPAPDRRPVELAEVGVERLGAGDHEHHGPEGEKADARVVGEERDPVGGGQGLQDPGALRGPWPGR